MAILQPAILTSVFEIMFWVGSLDVESPIDSIHTWS